MLRAKSSLARSREVVGSTCSRRRRWIVASSESEDVLSHPHSVNGRKL